MIYLDEELDFYKKICDIKNNVINNDKVYLLKFLNLREQEIVKDVFKNDNLLHFYGGYNDAEYKRVLITNYDNLDFKITIFKIKYNKKYLNLTHKNVLGTILSLGIKRDNIGDIIIKDDAYIIIASEMKEYIINNFKVINNSSIELEEYNGIIENKEEYNLETIYIKSMRVDIVISHALKISRNESYELITKGLVKINQKIIENTSQIVNVCDIISIRKYGRVKIIDNKGYTKSNNIVLVIGKLR